MTPSVEETFVPHVGWLAHEPGDDVGRYLREGWFEFAEQAFWWLLLRPGECVVDCGAHVGLFSVLASRAVGEYGRVIAFEPNPATTALLRQNLDSNGARTVEVIEAAAASASGSLTLHAGAGKQSAYSSSVAAVDSSSDMRVPAMTIDQVLRERDIHDVALLKLDVEGAELDAWRGCAETIKSARIGLVMVEFTEANQRAAGLASVDLARAWHADGYGFHRFDVDSLQLEPADIAGPIEYENLFATRDVTPINRRLREASAQRQRIARDVLARGRAAHTLLKNACDTQHLQQVIADLQQRLNEAIRRGDVAENQIAALRQRLRAYATFIQQTVRSRPLRLAYALKLTQPPAFDDHLARDAGSP